MPIPPAALQYYLSRVGDVDYLSRFDPVYGGCALGPDGLWRAGLRILTSVASGDDEYEYEAIDFDRARAFAEALGFPDAVPLGGAPAVGPAAHDRVLVRPAEIERWAELTDEERMAIAHSIVERMRASAPAVGTPPLRAT